MRNLISIFVLLLAFSFSVEAQKFGHVNSTQIIMLLPEVKAADSELENYQKQLIERGQAMVKAFETAYADYGQRANNGELSGIQMQQEEAKLNEQNQEIQKYEVEVQQLIAKKREEVYQPILNKVQETVNQIGKEMGYTMIFDTANGSLVYVQESEDLMPVVKERLGIAN